MVKLPKEIKSIKGSRVFEGEEIVKYGYVINEDKDGELYMPIELPYYYGVYLRPPASFDIIDDSREFVNGFKVVQTANLEYAYVREADNKLLPYRYDIATDFNEYGYAIVGKDARVSWIDRNFRYFDATFETFLDEKKNKSDRFNGFSSISNFSNGENHLSKLLRKDYDSDSSVIYLDTDGKIKKFYKYDGEAVCGEDFKKEFPLDSTTFNESDYATFYQNKFILLSSGYYLYTMDLIRICNEKGFLGNISEDIKANETRYQLFLNDVEEYTRFVANNISVNDDKDVTWNIGGIEFCERYIYDGEIEINVISDEYGKDVYRRADKEVPYKEGQGEKKYNRDFSKANRKLGCIIREFVSSSKVLDLDLFQELLAKRGIPSYIDYEENVFHYNTNKHIKVKK